MQKNTDPAQLERLATMRQLAAGVAHEIWNPLAVIKTMMFAMRADIRPEDPRCADFDVINKEVERMEQSIQRFLDYTWPPDPILAPVSLGQIVANAMELLGKKTEGQGVQVVVNVDRTLMILADQGQIEQVFVNLALNALQAMPEGGRLSIEAKPEQVFVNLALNAEPVTSRGPKAGEAETETAPGREREEGSGRVGVEMADTGIGIREETVGRVFEPFVDERGDGVGLGLAIVQQIVERHGGQIAAHNRPEGGALFTIMLPLAEV